MGSGYSGELRCQRYLGMCCYDQVPYYVANNTCREIPLDERYDHCTFALRYSLLYILLSCSYRSFGTPILTISLVYTAAPTILTTAAT